MANGNGSNGRGSNGHSNCFPVRLRYNNPLQAASDFPELNRIARQYQSFRSGSGPLLGYISFEFGNSLHRRSFYSVVISGDCSSVDEQERFRGIELRAFHFNEGQFQN